MISFIVIQDLTGKHPRNVSVALFDEGGEVCLLGSLPKNAKLGIDEPNARLLIDALLDKFPGLYQSPDQAD